jgi:hypothetical protein
VSQTGLEWERPGVLRLRDTGHASSVVTFWKIPAALDLNRIIALGQGFGDDRALSADSAKVACIEGGSLALWTHIRRTRRLALNVTPPDGHEQGMYLEPEGGALVGSLEEADWQFVLSPVISPRTLFRIAIYRDDSKRGLSGVA